MSKPAPSFTYSGTELEALSGAVHYYRWILSRFRAHLGKRAVEVGAGIGTFSEFLLKESSLSRLFLIEPDQENSARLRTHFDPDPRIEVRQGFLEDHALSLQADSVVAVNVLEHIRDDALFLRSAHEALKEGGTLLLFVPALAWLYGSLDEAAGHFRRYEKASLKRKIEGAGFRLLRLSFFNFPGILSWLLAVKLFRIRTLSRSQVVFYDRWVVPWLSAVEGRWEPPLGQSLLAVAQK